MYERYRVSNMDTLDSIATYFNTTKEKIMDINNLYNEHLRDGMDIVVPTHDDYFTYYTINKGDSLYSIGKRYNVNPTLLAAINGLSIDDYIYPEQKIMIPKSGYSFYITKEGDTLSSVAKTFNRNIGDLTKLNTTIYLLPGQLMINKTK